MKASDEKSSEEKLQLELKNIENDIFKNFKIQKLLAKNLKLKIN